MSSEKLIAYCKKSFEDLRRPEPVDALPGEHKHNQPMAGYDAEIYLLMAAKLELADKICQTLMKGGDKAIINAMMDDYRKSGDIELAIKYCDESRKILEPEVDAVIYHGLESKLFAAQRLFQSLSSNHDAIEDIDFLVGLYEVAGINPYYERQLLFSRANKAAVPCSVIYEYAKKS